MARSAVPIEHLPERLDALKQQLGFPADEDLAPLLRVRQRTLCNWRRSSQVDPKYEAGLIHLEDLLRRLHKLYPPEEIRAWLNRPNPLLLGETPLGALRSGKGEVVHHIVLLEEEGMGA